MDRQASIDQRERPDKTEPTLAAEAIENADASEATDPTERIEPVRAGATLVNGKLVERPDDQSPAAGDPSPDAPDRKAAQAA